MQQRRNRDKFKPKEWHIAPLPKRIELDSSVDLRKIYVEGYGDVAFWRGIFNSFEHDRLKFEISVPQRNDMAKGKQVLLKMLKPDEPNPDFILCMDSDFDYLFDSTNEQSHIINTTPNIFHTHAYSAENFLCYAPSLHGVCVKATKNDVRIFDFEKFLARYSRIIYPVFLWYTHSALIKSENYFPLIDFKTTVKLNYLDIHDNGSNTLEWLDKQVDRRLESLRAKYPHIEKHLGDFEQMISERGVTKDNVYLYMQGHTLMDNVVMVVLNAVCDQLRNMAGNKIAVSQKVGQALRNEMSNYNNELRNVREVLLDNENYKDCFLYQKLHHNIADYLAKL